MTAVGFIIWAVCVVFLKQEDEFFWNEYKRAYQFFNVLAFIGVLLMIAGVAIVLWRTMP